jgi:NAD(P)-dependent dehydrogenase (short-subunit alcohol dehydrogenase family)
LTTGRLTGKRCIVTGAAQGIGAAIAERFVAEGARVLLADIAASPLVERAARLGQPHRIADVAIKTEVEALVGDAAERWGGLDVIVNNAGITHAASLDDLTEDDFDRVLAVNLKSALWGTQAAARVMPPGAAVINMSSVNAVLAIPNQIPYAVSKGALRQLTNVTALAERGIRVNAIGPGSIETEMLAGILAEDGAARDRIMSRTPLGRCGTPEEIATVALFLASEDSSYLTGQTIYPDGGRLGLNYTVPVPPA